MSLSPDQMKEVLPFIEAYARGEELEWRTCTECRWLPIRGGSIEFPGFTLGAHCYRLAPKKSEKEKFTEWLKVQVDSGLKEFRVLLDPAFSNSRMTEEDFYRELNLFNEAAANPENRKPFSDSYLRNILKYNPVDPIGMKNFFVRIDKSAVIVGDKMYVGVRHTDCFDVMKKDGVRSAGHIDSQGFMDDYGNFYTRDQALYMVKKTGQLTRPLIGSVLTSEDLWDNEGKPHGV